MPTWKLTLEYDGAPFCGWQRQPNGRSVQQEVEEALSRLLNGARVRVTASGRTDAGVHARAQVVSFSTDSALGEQAFVRGLNAHLPPEIAVRSAQVAPEGFDARRWAHGKRYVYRVLNARVRSPLRSAQSWLVYKPLDLEAMRRMAADLVGTHDFEALRASDCVARTTTRRMDRAEVERREDEVIFTFEATAFLKHMVRNLVGTLVETGRGERDPASLPALLASRDRRLAGRTAPAQGLVLDEVFYDLDHGPPVG